MPEVIYVVRETISGYENSYTKIVKAFRNISEAEAYHDKMWAEAKDDNEWCYENGMDESISYGIETVELV